MIAYDAVAPNLYVDNGGLDDMTALAAYFEKIRTSLGPTSIRL